MVSAHDNTDSSRWLHVQIIVACVAIVCYGNTLQNDYCDDGVAIVAMNEIVQAPHRWLDCWTTDLWHMSKLGTPNRDLLYRPASLTSYRIVRSIFGTTALPQLATNLVLHAIISAGLICLGRKLGLSLALATASGLLFAVLPIHTEVINNVVGRADLLATLGILLCVLAHRRVVFSQSRNQVVWWSVISSLLAMMAMSAKENGVSVVVLLPVCHLYFCSHKPTLNVQRGWQPQRLIYFALPVIIYFSLRYYALEAHLFQKPALTKTINFLVDAPTWQRCIGTMQLWGMYWSKTFWPQVLCVNYSINELRLATSVFATSVLWGLLISILLLFITVYAWRRGQRHVVLIIACLLIVYGPTANLLVLIQVSFAERIWYLPSMWACLLIGILVGPVLRSRVGVSVGLMMILTMLGRCWFRNAEWKNNLTLYTSAHRVHPHGIGDLRLCGQALVNAGRMAEGINRLQQAIDIDLGFTDAQRSLGQAYGRAGKYQDALHHLQIANMQVPGHPQTMKALNEVTRLMMLAQAQTLEKLMRQATENPHNVEAEMLVVGKLRELNQLPQLLKRFTQKEKTFESNAQWQHEYAITYVYLDQRDQAIDRYHKSLALDTSNTQRMIELAMLLLERREHDDLEQAWQLTREAKAIEPHAPHVLVCQAELLALKGEFTQAHQLYMEVIRSLPDDAAIRRVYIQRVKALGWNDSP